MAEKPAVLQESYLEVHEGLGYRLLRGGSIQLNKLMFASIILLVVWLIWGFAAGHDGCVGDVPQFDDDGNEIGLGEKCSVWLTPTAKYLATMAIASFVASIAFGVAGLMVGKRIVEALPASEEIGAAGAQNEAPRGGDGEE